MKELNLNGAVVQAYPLTAAQRIHYYTVSACHRDELLNIATGFYIQYDAIDFETLKECIYDGYEKFESMRLRLVPDEEGNMFLVPDEEGNMFQYLIPKEDRDIRLVDFSNWREEDAHEEMKRWSRIPLMMDGGPMNEIVMIRLPDYYNGLYMKVHHMTMDSSSIISFYSYVLNLYCYRKFENVMPPKLPKSYLAQLKLDLAYDADREQMQNPKLRSCYGTGDLEADIKVYELENEPSKRLIDFSREYKIPVAVILLLGLRTTFSHFSGNEKDVSVKNAVARRGTLLESRSGGTRIHFWPLRTVIEPETTFLDALKIVQAKENALLRHANYDSILYMGETAAAYNAPQGTGYECTTLTYQPMSFATLKGQEIPDMNFKSKWYSNGVAMQHIYITVMHRPTDNGFSFNFEYEKNSVSLGEIEELYYYLCRAIFRGIEDPGRTIGEILDWM